MKKSEFPGLKNKVDICDLLETWKNTDFEKFISAIIEGDEVWEYDDIRCLSGSAGYIIIRGDEVISQYSTCIS